MTWAEKIINDEKNRFPINQSINQSIVRSTNLDLPRKRIHSQSSCWRQCGNFRWRAWKQQDTDIFLQWNEVPEHEDRNAPVEPRHIRIWYTSLPQQLTFRISRIVQLYERLGLKRFPGHWVNSKLLDERKNVSVTMKNQKKAVISFTVDQSINQSINQSIHRSIIQPINQSTDDTNWNIHHNKLTTNRNQLTLDQTRNHPASCRDSRTAGATERRRRTEAFEIWPQNWILVSLPARLLCLRTAWTIPSS